MCTWTLPAQVISQFTWNTIANGPLRADIGPNAISADSDVRVTAGGKNGTSGLNPGTVTANTNLTIANNPIFDVNGIDISFDYQRNESAGTLFVRGPFILGTAANVTVTYRTDNGSGGFRTVTSGNAAAFVDDDTNASDFGNIRFLYTPSTGLGELFFNGTRVWFDPAPVANRNLYWVGAGNIVLGNMIDGSLANLVVFDNLIIKEVEAAALPVEFTHFAAHLGSDQQVQLAWGTASERNSDRFAIESSIDSRQWNTIGSVPAAGMSDHPLDYTYIDASRETSALRYYRLKQIDLDGAFTYSKIVTVSFSPERNLLQAFPNPVRGTTTIPIPPNYAGATDVRVTDVAGKHVLAPVSVGKLEYTVDFAGLPPGTYHVSTTFGHCTVIRQ